MTNVALVDTSAVPEAKVGEPPDIAQADREPDQGQDELQLASPVGTCLLRLKKAGKWSCTCQYNHIKS